MGENKKDDVTFEQAVYELVEKIYVSLDNLKFNLHLNTVAQIFAALLDRGEEPAVAINKAIEIRNAIEDANRASISAQMITKEEEDV
jgi:hypothetical protein